MIRWRRWGLGTIALVMTVALVATDIEAVHELQDRHRFAVRGELVDVGGRRLNLQCSGSGSPTVVILPGAGETAAMWSWITTTVAASSRVCAYDRAGRGRSDAAPAPQDGIALATDLHTLLERAHVTGPLVLAGHSVGGLYARIYAARYPTQVAGVVLLDATHPEMFTRVPKYPGAWAGYRQLSRILPVLAGLGVGRIAYRHNFDRYPAAERDALLAQAVTPAMARSQRDEWAMIPTVMRQAGAVRTLGAIPLVVVTAMRDQLDQWLDLQRDLVTLSTNSVHRIVARASHMSLVDTEADAAISAQAILDVIAAVRTGGKVSLFVQSATDAAPHLPQR